MRVQRCKGTRDLSPQEMARFRRIENVFRDSCLKWGYQEVKTPTIEYLHLFTSAGTLTPSMLGRVYSFLDWDGWSGERVVLRPDGTIPVARLYIDSMADQELAKLFYVTNIFIFEETGKKTRERWQCGAELIGAGSPLADTELISLSLAILKKLGLKDIELRLSHAGFIRALLTRLGVSTEQQGKIFDQILDGNTESLAGIREQSPELEAALLPLLNLKGQAPGFLKNWKALFTRALPETAPYLDDFIRVADFLEELGCRYQIDITSGAGFEYYTGVIFQLFVGDEKVGGGGRYDALIPTMGGGNTAASGFALYLDRLMDLVKGNGAKPAPAVLVKVCSAEAVKTAFEAADRLREEGYIAELDLGGRGSGVQRWTLEVKGKAPAFVLTDKDNSRKAEAKNINEVLKSLEEKDADKGRPA
ncbi:MAG: ATP phosphoribosyltransferase regulatory subunit [Dehalococcoidales bacterium]|nr:ATP phosphoribosyltransferase regulatory subunit [Dehalococcoidales bacterium]